MKKKRVYVIYIVLFLVLISGLITGCEVLSSAPKLPDSEYPVDIIGRVTIAKTVIAGKTEHTRSGNDFWIVETSIRNKAYQTPVTATSQWAIGLESKPSIIGYIDEVFTPSSVTIPQGQSGKMILCFGLKAGLNSSDYQICLFGYASYATQKRVLIPTSYGNLINTNTIAKIYDWDSQNVAQPGKQTSPVTNIASVEGMSVQLVAVPWAKVGLCVQLKPINAKVGVIYTVSLYEKGNFRTSTGITWNQPELNVGTIKQVGFPLTDDELKAYYSASMSNNNWWKSIFSVKIQE
jgi:hypothetical protein